MTIRFASRLPRIVPRAALALGLSITAGCAAYPGASGDRVARLVPMSVIAGAGRAITLSGGHAGGGTAAVAFRRAAEPRRDLLAVVHRWVIGDVFDYVVSLRHRGADGAFVDLDPPLTAVVSAKEEDPAGTVMFTDLAHGEVYQAEVVARGNKDGTAPEQILTTQNRSVAIFDFSKVQDVEDTLVTDVRVVLDGMNFVGKGTVVIETVDGDYGRPDRAPAAADGSPTPEPAALATPAAPPEATPTPEPSPTPTPGTGGGGTGSGHGNDPSPPAP